MAGASAIACASLRSSLRRVFLGRELPSLRSCAAIAILVVGASLYVHTDASFEVRGYLWVCIWFVIFCFDQLYIKFAITAIHVKSNWGRVFYTNLWASVLLLGMTIVTEPHVLRRARRKCLHK